MVNDYRSFLKLSNGIYVLLSVAFVVGIAFAIDRYEAKPYPNEPSSAQLEESLQSALSAAGGERPIHLEKFHRGRATGLGGNTTLQSSLNDAKNQIVTGMTSAGWNLAESKKDSIGTEYLKFCRKGISAILDSRTNANKLNAYIGIVWAEDPNHYGYCLHPKAFDDSDDPIKTGQA